MFTYLWNDTYENLVVKSVGLNLFSLLGSSSSSSVDASSFVCVVILSLYLTLNLVISSLIVDTFNSVDKTLLDIYRGAITVARRTVFWYLCNISVFELLAVPQRGCCQTCVRWFCVWFVCSLTTCVCVSISPHCPPLTFATWNCVLVLLCDVMINVAIIATRTRSADDCCLTVHHLQNFLSKSPPICPHMELHK
jgi:hypothetical protein